MPSNRVAPSITISSAARLNAPLAIFSFRLFQFSGMSNADIASPDTGPNSAVVISLFILSIDRLVLSKASVKPDRIALGPVKNFCTLLYALSARSYALSTSLISGVLISVPKTFFGPVSISSSIYFLNSNISLR